MDFKAIWETFFGMVKLEEKSYTAAAKKPFTNSLVLFAIAAVAMALGTFWTTLSIGGFIGDSIAGFIGVTIGFFVFVGIVWIIAKLFGGKGAYMHQYNASSYIALWNVLYIVPVVGQTLAGLGSLWSIVMTVFVVKNVHKLSTGKAVVVVLVPLIIVMVFAFIFAAALLATLAAAGITAAGLPA